MSTAISDTNLADQPQPSVLRVDSLADTMLILLSLTIVQRLLGFGRSVLLCRWLDPEQLGQWDLAFGFLVLAAPAAVLGLPGSFRRYVEHYRQRGQLRSFLRQIILITAALTGVAVAIVSWTSPWFSQVIFGRDDCVQLVRVSAAGLALIVAHNVMTELFASLRLFRFVSLLQFVHSLLFAGLSLALIGWWRTSAEGVVIAYALACLVCSLIAMALLRRAWDALPGGSSRLSQRTLLTRLMPFAIWVWATDWLTNLFDIATRYLIVHCSGLGDAEALVQVGNYHSARVVPLLLVTIAGMLASAALPHMSHDWERGKRRSVSSQINLMFKLVIFGLTAGGVAILLAEPLLFDVAFGGKYSGGREILPFTITACVWFGVIGITHTYLCCAERAMLSSLALLTGILVNVGLNLLLLPRYGLTGAIAATAAGNITTLSIALLCCLRWGLRFDPGVWFMLTLPVTLSVGPWLALSALGITALWAMNGQFLLSTKEKAELVTAWRNYRQKIPRFTRPLAASQSS